MTEPEQVDSQLFLGNAGALARSAFLVEREVRYIVTIGLPWSKLAMIFHQHNFFHPHNVAEGDRAPLWWCLGAAEYQGPSEQVREFVRSFRAHNARVLEGVAPELASAGPEFAQLGVLLQLCRTRGRGTVLIVSATDLDPRALALVASHLVSEHSLTPLEALSYLQSTLGREIGDLEHPAYHALAAYAGNFTSKARPDTRLIKRTSDYHQFPELVPSKRQHTI